VVGRTKPLCDFRARADARGRVSISNFYSITAKITLRDVALQHPFPAEPRSCGPFGWQVCSPTPIARRGKSLETRSVIEFGRKLPRLYHHHPSSIKRERSKWHRGLRLVGTPRGYLYLTGAGKTAGCGRRKTPLMQHLLGGGGGSAAEGESGRDRRRPRCAFGLRGSRRTPARVVETESEGGLKCAVQPASNGVAHPNYGTLHGTDGLQTLQMIRDLQLPALR